MEIFENAPERAYAWAQAGRGAALATVVETWGSAPRRVGAQLAIAADGEMQGSVSGGCVEGAVVVEALEAIEDGAPRLQEYGVSDGDAFAVGLACGGKIRVLVEPVGEKAMPFDVLGELVRARAARQPVAYQVPLSGGVGRLVTGGYADRFRMDRSGVEEDGDTFVAVHNPPLRLVIVGAVHIAQALVPMAQVAGFDAVVIDPPRAGAEAQIAEIVKAMPPVLAYVSCNPVTFARDAAVLIAAGYTLNWVQVVDQFRWSSHVELAAQFTAPEVQRKRK